MITFAVDDVALGKGMRPLDRVASINSLLNTKAEALYASDKPLVDCNDVNAMVNAAYLAFYHHYPLVLSPDAIWLTMAQGFALHVNENAEALRSRFVSHAGKKTLGTMVAETLVLGQPFPWTTVVAGFSHQLKLQLGKTRDLVVCDFSTTTENERVASEIVLMNAFQAYFDYLSMGGCGIPSITLLGTPEDWRSIRTRAAALGEYGLEEWAAGVAPVLDELVRTAEGKVDRNFWKSFFHWEGGSGPDEVTGWILTLFPKMKIDTPKPGLKAFPGALTSVPVTHVNMPTNDVFSLKFVGGLFGVTQDPGTLALAPEAGWAIVSEAPLHPRPLLVEGDQVRTLRMDHWEKRPAGTVARIVALKQRRWGWEVRLNWLDMETSFNDEFDMPSDEVELLPDLAGAQFAPSKKSDVIRRYIAEDIAEPLRPIVSRWFEALSAHGDGEWLMDAIYPAVSVGTAPLAFMGVYGDTAAMYFFHGAQLPDPHGLLEGHDPRGRRVILNGVNEDALRALMDAAAADARIRHRT